jgi:hypothetical protein
VALFCQVLLDIERALHLSRSQSQHAREYQELPLAPEPEHVDALPPPPPPPRPKDAAKLAKRKKRDEFYLRELRIVLRSIVNRLLSDRRFANTFAKLPV